MFAVWDIYFFWTDSTNMVIVYNIKYQLMPELHFKNWYHYQLLSTVVQRVECDLWG